MANIATVATVAIMRTEATDHRISGHALLRAMTRYYGRTYCVPTWIYNDYPQGCIYTALSGIRPT